MRDVFVLDACALIALFDDEHGADKVEDIGSFGIGMISFLALGDFIRIFTRREGNKI